MELFLNLQNGITKYSNRNAFYINEKFYTYSDFATVISQIRKSIRTNTVETEKNIGLVTNNDIESYAGIIALWFEGKAYVPIGPKTPQDRNKDIIEQADLKTIIDSSEEPLFPEYKTIRSKKLPATPINLNPKQADSQELAYLLFTSGTTGIPKGIPITRENVSTFSKAFWEIGFDIDENDKFLQMSDLTFDLSVISYLAPLLKGSCIYTIPVNKIKYSYVYKLLDEQKLTVTIMVPSMLQYLRPYFEEMDFPDMKYSLFCGEALPLDISEEWDKCLPNGKIINFYGPTENTVFCTYYEFNKSGKNKSHNNILSVGKPMNGTEIIIIDENNNIVPTGDSGELCLKGEQLTPNYWKNKEKSKEVFFFINRNGKKERFYRTGDLCKCDTGGDLIYLGRVDFQTQIQGFRVELSEIEFYATSFLKKTNIVVVSTTDAIGNEELSMLIEAKRFDITQLLDYLKTKMPAYMIPKHIEFIDQLPLNTNGKTDRKKIKELFENSYK